MSMTSDRLLMYCIMVVAVGISGCGESAQQPPATSQAVAAPSSMPPPPASPPGSAAPSAAAPAPAAPAPRYGRRCADHPVNCAYNTTSHRPASGLAAVGETREVRRTQGTPPAKDTLPALVDIRITALGAEAERWRMSIEIIGNAHRKIDPKVTCEYTNGGQPVAAFTWTASSVVPGQIVSVASVGPAVSATYVDGAICRVIGPFK